MDITQVFRAFLIGDALLTVASIATGALASDNTPDRSSESLAYIVVAGAVLLAWVIALAGLWRFRHWARGVCRLGWCRAVGELPAGR
ncbi:MAG: hypothetical protein ACRDHF_16905 [Tepidiformaceae bacterium]